MAKKELDVIIPVKDRATILDCVSTLLAEAALAQEICVRRILLCEGGSRDVTCQTQLQQVTQFPQVEILTRPQAEFNKGWLLNQGLAAAKASLILISDVDILWNAATLNQLGNAAARHPDYLYWIKSVQESDPQTVASHRPRYTYRLSQTPTSQCIEVYAAPPTGGDRPGYGLLCGQQSLFKQVGGYRHCFRGWGWEDQDLLMRAQLLGYQIAELGTVVHLSHGDEQRNLENGQQSPQQTPQQSRDRNIRRCLAGLTQGKLRGDLPQTGHNPQDRLPPSHPAITVHYSSLRSY